ncbi:hypothetical protein [Geodermatophilus sp. URMC 62]|uniref:hypothetical protein n=1 Tax=Geodermatophilus sp. URMC 62 TaxID=3423414 RepID=UPI00406D24E4
MDPDAMTPDERWLTDEVSAGRPAAFPDDDRGPRSIRAEVIRDLAVQASRPAGVRVVRANITGELNLRFSDILGPLALCNCTIERALVLDAALLADLDLTGSVLPGISAQDVEVRHSITMTKARVNGATDLTNATLGGHLNLSGGKLRNPDGVALDADQAQIGGGVFCGEGFEADGAVQLVSASVGVLHLSGGKFRHPGGTALNADGAQATGGVFCGEGFEAEGAVRLVGASVGGQLHLSGGKLRNPGGNALEADRVQIGGGVFCEEGFEADGAVRLLGASVGSQLHLSGGKFRHPDGYALSADGAQVTGAVFCGEGFEVEGAVRLSGASVSGQLVLSGGKFRNPGGVALDADQAQIGGGVFCGEGFEADGAVRLLGASVELLNLSGGKFRHPDGTALNAYGAQVTGAVFCGEGFEVEGAVRLSGASVGGQLILSGGKFRNPGGTVIDATRATIGTLSVRGMGQGSEGVVDLSAAHIGFLNDSTAGWKPFELRLFDLTYDRISHAGWTTQDRLAWLNKDSEYRAQPYEQLAKVFRAQGHELDARAVMVAKFRRRRRQLPRWRRGPEWLFDGLLGYGYRPLQRTVPLLLALYLLGTLLLVPAARDAGAVIATRAPAGSTAGSGPLVAGEKCPDNYPCFSPWQYTFDTVVPLVSTRQGDYWTITSDEPAGHRAVVYRALAGALGWVLATAAALGFTGLIRRRD